MAESEPIEDSPSPADAPPRSWLRGWPWGLLALLVAAAVWHAVDFPDDVDPEYPGVVRPNFSAFPPPAYRLAEPGDTIDRIAVYVSSLAVVLALVGLLSDPGRGRAWLGFLAIAAGAFWLGANPGPTFDGWHGLGWGSIFGPGTPAAQRVGLVLVGLGLGCLVARGFGEGRALCRERRSRGVVGILGASAALGAWRVLMVPDVEPFGYWPRWALAWSLALYCAGLVRLLPALRGRRLRNLGLAVAGPAAWYALVVAGIGLTWFHRPLDRFREVVPGRIFISAMPTARGLGVAHARHHFKTIINLFPEDTPLQSPLHGEEVRFAREHGIRYVGSPADVASSNAFLDTTLALARDPDAWPILVHCHGCMDRTPAWVGIYRYVVESGSLADAFRFIERHRGYRPKASVTLLYNRVLPRLAPDRCRVDPAFAALVKNARGTEDPYLEELRAERSRLNRRGRGGVTGGAGAESARRDPNLTDRR